MILLPQKVAYRGSVSDLRISSVDGTAFIDNLPSAVTDLVAADPGNYLLEIYDATGKVLKGYLSAAGTGETYLDILAGWNLTSGWTMLVGGTIVDADTFTTTVADGPYRNNSFPVTAALYKRTFERNTTSTGCVARVAVNSNYNPLAGVADISTGSAYHTAVVGYTNLYIRNAWAGTTDITSLKAEQVLTPSTSGCVIVSTKGGATENFSYKSATFSYNQASYQVVVRKAR